METIPPTNGQSHSLAPCVRPNSSPEEVKDPKDQRFRITNIFRRHLDNDLPDPDKITPYEVTGFPKCPGSSNLLSLPGDAYITIKSLASSIKHEDVEEAYDTSTRLFAMPANFISAIGLFFESGASGTELTTAPPSTTMLFLPFAYVAGIIFCFAEGLINAWSLNRQYEFEDQFDFDFLSNLRYMVSDFDPLKSSKAIENMVELLDKNPEALKQLFGESFEDIKKTFGEMRDKLEEDPYSIDSILITHSSFLEDIACKAVEKNLQLLKEQYLSLNSEEIIEVYRHVLQNNSEKSPEDIHTITIKKLQKKLTVKKKNLARRIRPWMAIEASSIASSTLDEVMNKNSEAIKKGLCLMDDIHNQSAKKKIAHILGIITLVLAAASLAAMCFACLAFAPPLLAGVILICGFARALVYSGSLESRGWTFEPRKCLPQFIQDRIWKESDPDTKRTAFYRRAIVPLRAFS